MYHTRIYGEHHEEPTGKRMRYSRQRTWRYTWRVWGPRRYFSPDVTGFPTKLWSRLVCAVGQPWLHNNEGDSGNCFYVSGIAQRATIASRCCIPATSWRTRERWDDRRETKGIEVACRCSQRVWRARARHYASLGNLANDSIEAAGMSSMWT